MSVFNTMTANSKHLKNQEHEALGTQTLSQLGERRLVDEIILNKFPSVIDSRTGQKDDCATIDLNRQMDSLVWTIDPCPTPVISLLGDEDPFHSGVMTAIISLSDLAAMGAKPLGIQVSIEAPNEMFIRDFERYLEGLHHATNTWKCPVLGGNVKDASVFSATGTALGHQKRDNIMRRVGMSAGDHLLAFGRPGAFWSAALIRMGYAQNIPSKIAQELNQALTNPIPRIEEGIQLAEGRLATACIDASDGLYGALLELSIANDLSITLDPSRFSPEDSIKMVADSAGISPMKLLLSWGDWELVFAASPNNLKHIRKLAKELNTDLVEIGIAGPGPVGVFLNDSGKLKEFRDISSQRFSKTSYFTHGLDSYVKFLIEDDLYY